MLTQTLVLPCSSRTCEEIPLGSTSSCFAVPIRLPRLVWISSSCGSVVVRRSSRSLCGFGASLPVAWSRPTLVGIKLVILRCSQQVILWFPTYCREDRANSRTEIVSVLIMWYQSYRYHGRFCYYLLIYLFVYHLLLLLSITYICFAISYSPKPHKKYL